jgi:hypothetical protein
MAERTDYGPILGSGWAFLASTIVLIVGVIVAITWWKNPLTREAGLIALGVAVIPWAIMLFRFYRLRSALGTADLHFEDSVPLGYNGTASYVRPLRGAELRTVEARLQCEEEVTKGSGKNKRQMRKVVYDEELKPTVTPMMERLDIRIPLRIPATGPATIWHEYASVTWWLRLRLRMHGCPNTQSSFKIEVLPAVMER